MSGIFGLSSYNDQNLEGLIPNKTREAFREFGYFGSGTTPAAGYSRSTTVDRIDYSNDTATASLRGPLTLGGYDLSATGNSNFGYYGGGNGGLTKIDRIDYANDSSLASPRASLNVNRYNHAATGNSNFGYFGGGYRISPNGSLSSIERIQYSNDLSSLSFRGPLSIARYVLDATGNSNFGYFIGGFPSSSRLDRIDYQNDIVIASIRNNSLNPTFSNGSATGNSNFGYFGGGSNVSLIRRISYTNDLVSPITRGPLSAARQYLAATGNSNFGYFGGGSPTSLSNISIVDRIDYSNDTVTASVRGPLSVGRYGLSATSSHSFGGAPISQYGVFAKPFGYFGGGANLSFGAAGSRSKVDRIDYSNDTATASTRGPLTLAKGNLAATGNGNFGYFGGGYYFPNQLSLVDRINYSNDTATALARGPLSLARSVLAATGNSNFGWFGGGTTPTPISVVDRINYSNDTATASARGFLSLGRMGLSSTGTSNFAYYAGGATETPAPTTFRSTVDRIDYSNDNATAVSRNNLTIARRSLAAIGNQSFGYFGGGGDATSSTIERLDYSSDTTAIAGRSNLTIPRNNLAATGNNNFGYFSGNRDIFPGASTVERLDYSNDTATTTLRGSLTEGIGNLAATSPTAFGGATDFTPTQQFFDIQSMRRIEDTTNESVKKRALGSYGYWIGGSPASSIIQRLDFSNDLSNASSRSTTSMNTYNLGSTSTNNYGWCHGGDTGLGPISFTDRIDYSNDTSKPLNRSVFAGSRECGASGNLYYGWVYSGYDTSRIIRLDYSNDLGGFLTRNSLTERKRHTFGVGNFNYGWICGGQELGSFDVTRSTIERLDYSNDDVKPSVRGSLTAAKYRGSTTGNLNFGYYGGGRLSPSSGLLISTIERISYSNDTSNAIVRTSLSGARYNLSATGNNNFGYFGHGAVSTIERLDYSNDSASTSIRGPLVNSLRNSTATTNARSS